MDISESSLLGLAAALGGGLLIGIERERRKGVGPGRGPAGVRTFALASLLGAFASALALPGLVATGAVLVGLFAAIGYWRKPTTDPGMTTALALVVTYLLGVLAIGHPGTSAGGAVVVAVLLASRRSLHEFSVDTLSEVELRDGLLFAAATLILLPLLPDASQGWAGGANPRRLWGLVVLFMALQAGGYVALRAAGPRLGLAFSGLLSGFVSSTGTIAALGARARETPDMRPSCVAGALFSTVSTVLLLGVVVLAVYPPALQILWPSLACGLLAAMALATASVLRQRERPAAEVPKGHAFKLLYALGFAAILGGVTLVVSLVSAHLGPAAATAAAGLAGLFDVHAASASTLSLAATGQIAELEALRLPVLIALTTNTASKLGAAFLGGGVAYGTQVGVGLVMTLAAIWLPLLLAG